jgi:LuxR family maltose regulon positive regulatory protein
VIAEAEGLASLTPDVPVLRRRLTAIATLGRAVPVEARPGLGALTPAELRVLQFLPTHLTFEQIANRLYLSRNTVKTEVISSYRKLGVTSRGSAVERAHVLGLIDV